MSDTSAFDAQSIYDELNRRGVFVNNPTAQAIGHELRRRGVVKDATQGGLVKPAAAQPAPQPNYATMGIGQRYAMQQPIQKQPLAPTSPVATMTAEQYLKKYPAKKPGTYAARQGGPEILSIPAAAKKQIAARRQQATQATAGMNPFEKGVNFLENSVSSLLTVPGMPYNSALENEVARQGFATGGVPTNPKGFLPSVAPGLMQKAQDMGGVPRGLANVASSIVTPTNAVLMAALPELQGMKALNAARRAINAYFTVSMAKGTLNAARDKKLMQEDPRAYLTQVIGQGALALLAAHGTAADAKGLLDALGKGKKPISVKPAPMDTGAARAIENNAAPMLRKPTAAKLPVAPESAPTVAQPAAPQEVPPAAPTPVAEAGKPVQTVQTATPQIADEKAFYAFRRTEGQADRQFVKVEGKPVKIPGFESLDTFITHSPGDSKLWDVVEGRTGLSLTQLDKTQAQALASAADTLKKQTQADPNKMEAVAQQSITKYGLSPRYKQGEPNAPLQAQPNAAAPAKLEGVAQQVKDAGYGDSGVALMNAFQRVHPDADPADVLRTARAIEKEAQSRKPDEPKGQIGFLAEAMQYHPKGGLEGTLADLDREEKANPQGGSLQAMRNRVADVQKFMEPQKASEPAPATPAAAEPKQSNVQVGAEPKQTNVEARPEPTVTKAANAHAAEERAKLDLSELPPTERLSVASAFKQAEGQHLASDALQRANQVLAKPRNLSDVETAGLVQRMQEIKDSVLADRKKIAADIAQGGTDAAQLTRAHHDALLDEYDTIDRARKAAGAEWARTGLARQVTINSYDFTGTIRRLKAANPEKAVTPQEESKVDLLTSRLADTEAKLAAQAERVKELEAQAAARKMGLEARRSARKMTRADLDKELDGMLKEFGQKAGGRSYSAIDPTLYPLVGKIALNRLQANVKLPVEGLVDEVYNILKDHVEDITRRDVRDAISGYGKEEKPRNANPLVAQMRDLQKQMKLISAIEDVQQRIPPAQGKKPGLPSEKVVALKKQLDDLMLKTGMKPVHVVSDVARLRMLKDRTQKAIDDLNRRIATGDTSKPTQRASVPLDREAESLKRQRDLLKHQLDQMVAARQKPHPLDYLLRWQRLSLLSGVGTLGKLGAAALGRVGFAPLENIVGVPLARTTLGKMAPREGGFNMQAEVKAFRETFSRAMLAGAKQAATKGENPIDLQFKKPSGTVRPNSAFWDLFGRLHGALKTPAQYNEFYRSLEYNAAWEMRRGRDPHDPAVAAEIAGRAYNDSLRAKLMSDNVAVSAFKGMLRVIEQKGGKGGQVATRLIQSQLPIVKIPTNFIGEAAQYAPGGGLAYGLTKTVLAGGVRKLTPEGADAVLRAYKKQGVGAALFALGYVGANSVGGYYQRNEKRNPNAVQPGELEVFGVRVPHWLAHSPPLEALQMGATVQRAIEATRGSGTDKTGQAALSTGVGLAEQIPFYDEMVRASRATETTTAAGKFAGAEVKGILIPRMVQEAAQKVDSTPHRYPRGFTEEVKTAVPGLRQQVPAVKQRAGRQSKSESLTPRRSRGGGLTSKL